MNKVATIVPQAFSDISEAVARFGNGECIIVDLSGASEAATQRITDYLCGAAAALKGGVARLKKDKYILMPEGARVRRARK